MIPKHNRNWCSVGGALDAALPSLRRLMPPVMSTIHVGPSNGAPDRYRITLKVFTDHDLRPEEKERIIQQAKPIIEGYLQSGGYPSNAIRTFEYGVMYENADRNMKSVGAALESVAATLRAMSPPVVSTCHLGDFSGEPDGFGIYLGVTSKEDVERAERGWIESIKAALEQELVARGYSRDAIGTFSYRIVRQQDVDKAGGWYGFLR